MSRLAKVFAAGVACAYPVAYILGKTWGTTREERARSLPGDETVPDPQMGGDHAITIDRPPEAVWPWLKQVGWHRGGWYTYRWVDALFFPHNAASASKILPEFQTLQVGDTVPDGPPDSGCFFRVQDIEEARHLVLHSTTHLPAQLRRMDSVALSWTWTFVLEPVCGGQTRFHFRWRARVRPLWLRIAADVFVTPADFVMGRSMCKGLKRRVEATPRSSLPGG